MNMKHLEYLHATLDGMKKDLVLGQFRLKGSGDARSLGQEWWGVPL